MKSWLLEKHPTVWPGYDSPKKGNKNIQAKFFPASKCGLASSTCTLPEGTAQSRGSPSGDSSQLSPRSGAAQETRSRSAASLSCWSDPKSLPLCIAFPMPGSCRAAEPTWPLPVTYNHSWVGPGSAFAWVCRSCSPEGSGQEWARGPWAALGPLKPNL